MMRLAASVLFVCTAWALTRPAIAQVQDPAFESYLAHIAAAEGEMRRGATAECKRWLNAVPASERKFEWHWLNSEADQCENSHRAHEVSATMLSLSPDGSRLATGGNDGRLRIWKFPGFVKEREIEAHKASIFCIAWDSEGKRIAVSSADKGAKVFNADDGALLSEFKNHTYPVTTIRFSPDGKRLLSTSYQRPKGGEVRIWDAATGSEERVLQSGYAPITCAHWNGDGSKIVAASWDQHLHIFDLSKEEKPIVARLGSEGEYRAAQMSALSPDGTLVAVGGKDDEVHLFEAWTGKHVRDLKGHRSSVEGLAFSPDGRVLASSSADTSIIFWDVASGKKMASVRGHEASVRGLAFTPDGRTLLSASHDGTVRTWNAEAAMLDAGRLEFSETAYHVLESPDGTRVAVGFSNGDVRVFRRSDKKEIQVLPGHRSWANWLQWSADGRRLMSSGDAGVAVFDVESREVVAEFGEKLQCDSAAWSADGSKIAAVSRDAKVRLFDLASKATVWEIAFPSMQSSIAFVRDGAAVVIGGNGGELGIHETATGALLQKLKGHVGRVKQVKVSKDGRHLASTGEDGTVRLWNVADGNPLGMVKAHDNGGSCLAFSPDGTRLATGGGNDRLFFWQVPELVRVLTLDQKDAYALNFSEDGKRLWVLPLSKSAHCLSVER